MEDNERANAITAVWKLHDKVGQSIGAVDAKASFLATLQTGSLAVVFALLSGNRNIVDSSGVTKVVFLAGLLCLCVANILSISIVVPRLRLTAAMKSRPEWSRNYTYFGFSRHWSADELLDSVKFDSLEVMLAEQVIVLARISWSKHLMALFSSILTIAALLLIVSSTVMSMHLI